METSLRFQDGCRIVEEQRWNDDAGWGDMSGKAGSYLNLRPMYGVGASVCKYQLVVLGRWRLVGAPLSALPIEALRHSETRGRAI